MQVNPRVSARALATVLLMVSHARSDLQPHVFIFDFDCASPNDYPNGTLMVDMAPEIRDDGGKVWADRAVTYDLDEDGTPEYFVPISCGATGNCLWGAYDDSPSALLGMFSGARFYITERLRWPRITTYVGSGWDKGWIHDYEFRSGAYVGVGSRLVEFEEKERFLEEMGDPECWDR